MQLASWSMRKAGSREGLLSSLGAQRMCSPGSVVVPVGAAVGFFSSLGVVVEKAACHGLWGGCGGRTG